MSPWPARAQDDNPALFDWGTFINGGSPDPTWVRAPSPLDPSPMPSPSTRPSTGTSARRSSSPPHFTPAQNEIDQIFRIGPNGSEYHATYFTPGEHKTVFNPYSDPPFNGYIESSYHNYTLYWTPDYLAWTIDKETYRNITYRSTTNRRVGGGRKRRPASPVRGCPLTARHARARAFATRRPPWRPMSYRLIFRTENSSYPGPAQARPLRRLARHSGARSLALSRPSCGC